MSNQPFRSEQAVLAIDPGRLKTGLAVVRRDGCCVHREIVETPRLASAVERLVEQHQLTVIVVGDRTTAKGAMADLAKAGYGAIVPIDEHRSTEEARQLYFDTVPTRGLARLIPRGLRTPACPVDDYAAWVLGRRYFSAKEGEDPSPNTKA